MAAISSGYTVHTGDDPRALLTHPLVNLNHPNEL